MAITSKTLRIADNAAMTNARTIAESATPNQFDISELDPETTYYVEVDVVNARGTGTSAQENFTTDEHIGLEPFNIRNISSSAATVDWNTNADNRNLQYSEDKRTWTNVPYANGKYSVTIPVGKKYYFQGNSTNWGGWWGADEDVEVGGYVLSLHSPDYSYTGSVSYNSLFDQYYNSANASHLYFDFAHLYLPVKNRVVRTGFSYMFRRCTSITALNYDIFYTDDGTVALDDNCFNAMFEDVPNLTRVDGFNLRRFRNMNAWQEFKHLFHNCTSLQYVADDFFDTTVTPSTAFFREGTFERMFEGCTSLTHPPILPNGRIWKTAFAYMFNGCTSLTNATKPALPLLNNGNIGTDNTYLYQGCFQGIFYGCTGITQMDDLSGFNMGSAGNSYFREMYAGTGITSIDAAKMPTGTITNSCFYAMFRGTPITSIPSNLLQSTTLANNCYGEMFANCTSLTALPSGLLPATTLAQSCYYRMFYGCRSITSLPNGFLPATTLANSCYYDMFNGANLSSVPQDLLQATTLADSCYLGMFGNCASLVTLPDLPARTLVNNCYQWMFYHTGGNTIEVDFKEWAGSYTGEWMSNVSSTGTFICFEELPEERGTSRIPTNWTIVRKVDLIAPTISHDDTDVILTNTTYNNRGDIYYTTDGSTPTSSSTLYTAPFLGVIGTTVKAVVIYNGQSSEVSTWVVVAQQLVAPTIAGTPSEVTITNNDTSSASAIYYTTDGTTPTSSSTLYQQPFTVTAGTVVKAICVNTTGGQLISDSEVVSKEITALVEIAYIHNQTMTSSPNWTDNISTGILMDNTIKFRYKGKSVGYWSGGVNVGWFTVDSNDLRLFFYNGGVYLDWGSSRQQVGYSFNGDFDFTCANNYCYDNIGERYLFQGNTANYTNTENLSVDCTSFWLKSLQVWKTINNVKTLVFDGVAAELNGTYGLWDKVSNQMFTNSNITIVGESL